jgi:RNA-binding protein YhbY
MRLPPSKGADLRVRLVALEFLEGREVRVLVAEADDEADRDQVVAEVIEEAAAVGVGSIGQPPVCITRPF